MYFTSAWKVVSSSWSRMRAWMWNQSCLIFFNYMHVLMLLMIKKCFESLKHGCLNAIVDNMCLCIACKVTSWTHDHARWLATGSTRGYTTLGCIHKSTDPIHGCATTLKVTTPKGGNPRVSHTPRGRQPRIRSRVFPNPNPNP
jgi:hypothetical protein